MRVSKMESSEKKLKSEPLEQSIQQMIDESKLINESGRKRAAGTKFMTELLDYITSESKRRYMSDPKLGSDREEPLLD